MNDLDRLAAAVFGGLFAVYGAAMVGLLLPTVAEMACGWWAGRKRRRASRIADRWAGEKLDPLGPLR